jgi:hypothetical protein
MKKVILIITIILIPALIWAQKKESKGSTSLSFESTFDNDSKPDDITFNIEPGTESLNLRVMSLVKSGMIVVEIYDPANNKQGGFSVGSKPSGENKKSSGTFQKLLKEPLSGTWTVKIAPTAAKGTVQVETYFLQ